MNSLIIPQYTTFTNETTTWPERPPIEDDRGGEIVAYVFVTVAGIILVGMVAMMVISTLKMRKSGNNKVDPTDDPNPDLERGNSNLSKSVSLNLSRNHTLTSIEETMSQPDAAVQLQIPKTLVESPPQDVSGTLGFASSAEMDYFICSKGETLVEVTDELKKATRISKVEIL